jgi:small-conductance mechanosensitive channel
VTIPNTTLTDEAIERPYEGGTGRFVEEVDIAYEDDVDAAIDLLGDIAADVEGVLADPEHGPESPNSVTTPYGLPSSTGYRTRPSSNSRSGRPSSEPC